MQILHTGRYAYSTKNVAPSPIQSPITPFKPRALTDEEVWKTIADYAHCALLAKKAGYDGVEIMGSEGYLINQFIVSKTNQRQDEWGGAFENRIRFPLEIVRQTRAAVGDNFIIIFRLSLLDLIQEGSSWEETVQLAKALEEAGVSIINTGIGWHEARIPTIATMVPRAAFTWVTKPLNKEVNVPLITTNRINMPDVAEAVLAAGHADMVSMARPMLTDPEWVNKAESGREDEINTCIGCNQGCLDYVFEKKRATCMLNPQACYETELTFEKAQHPKTIAVIGAGPGGLAFACYAATRGHQVTIYDKNATVGGQFNIAKQIPGKEEFYEALRYFEKRCQKLGVSIQLNQEVTAADLLNKGIDRVVLATGVSPRVPKIPGINHPKVLSYVDVIKHKKTVGEKVAVIGAGGIGFDTSE